MITVTFRAHGEDVVARADAGETLLQVARRAGVAIDAPCSGSGTCGKCRVRLLSGGLDSPRTRHLAREEYDRGWRLACASAVVSDATVEVPDAASAYRSGMRVAELSSPNGFARFRDARAALEAAGIAFGSGFSSVVVGLEPPGPGDAAPDNERLARKLRELTGAEAVKLTHSALRKLARTMRAHGFRARCVLERSGGAATVLDVLPPGDGSPVAGLAVDLGTTSVAALLVDLEDGHVLAGASAGNAQIRYGADVISRIIESTREGGEERLQRAIVDETLRPLIGELCAAAGIRPEGVYRACVAGNTTMNHLLLGLYCEPVRMEPYVPSFFRCDDIPASSLGLGLHPDAAVALAPNVGSYVGGDITAGTLASMIWNREEISLFVDLGTNGELVLGNGEFLMCCACSAGPAFEGGDMSCGMRATDGAIDSVAIDPETMEPRYTTVGDARHPLGICGSGIVDLVAELFRAGIIDGRGRLIRSGRRVRFDESGMGSYVVAFAEETGAERDVSLTEADIDNFIRAKGAVYSAVTTMLNSIGLEPDALERVYVAGGIGGGVNLRSAVAVGMLPDLPAERFAYVGNTSLTGAYAMLASAQCREKVEALAGSMTYLELSTEPGYMDAFVGACFLPHTDAVLFPGAGS